MGTLCRPPDANREVRSLHHGLVSPNAGKGNRHPNAGAGFILGALPVFFQGISGLRQIDVTGHLSTKKRFLAQKAFADYWETGGFPEVVGLDRRLRIKIHQEYFHALLFRDLVERHDISHPQAVKDLAHRLIDNFGLMFKGRENLTQGAYRQKHFPRLFGE